MRTVFAARRLCAPTIPVNPLWNRDARILREQVRALAAASLQSFESDDPGLRGQLLAVNSS